MDSKLLTTDNLPRGLITRSLGLSGLPKIPRGRSICSLMSLADSPEILKFELIAVSIAVSGKIAIG